MAFTADLGKVSRRERKEIQLSFVLIVLNDRKPSEAKFLCALCVKISYALRHGINSAPGKL
jgi:hypothetical protein